MTQSQAPAAPAAKTIETVDVSMRYRRDDNGATVTLKTSARWRALLKRLCDARAAARHNMANPSGTGRLFTYAAPAGTSFGGTLDAAAFATHGPDGTEIGAELAIPILQPMAATEVREYLTRVRDMVERVVSMHLQPIDMTVSVRTVTAPGNVVAQVTP